MSFEPPFSSSSYVGIALRSHIAHILLRLRPRPLGPLLANMVASAVRGIRPAHTILGEEERDRKSQAKILMATFPTEAYFIGLCL